jgi:hypothetical protein
MDDRCDDRWSSVRVSFFGGPRGSRFTVHESSTSGFLLGFSSLWWTCMRGCGTTLARLDRAADYVIVETNY